MPNQTPPYPAPAFLLSDPDGQMHNLSDCSGQWLVLYFYPKDDTPGCTVEACSLRDSRDDLIELGAQIVGISKDNEHSHDHFREKYKLNFTLLSDTTGTTIRAYGAWGKKMFGHEGILRKTFIIDPQGQVVKVFGRVTPAGHGQQVVETLKALQQQA